MAKLIRCFIYALRVPNRLTHFVWNSSLNGMDEQCQEKWTNVSIASPAITHPGHCLARSNTPSAPFLSFDIKINGVFLFAKDVTTAKATAQSHTKRVGYQHLLFKCRLRDNQVNQVTQKLVKRIHAHKKFRQKQKPFDWFHLESCLFHAASAEVIKWTKAFVFRQRKSYHKEKGNEKNHWKTIWFFPSSKVILSLCSSLENLMYSKRTKALIPSILEAQFPFWMHTYKEGSSCTRMLLCHFESTVSLWILNSIKMAFESQMKLVTRVLQRLSFIYK